jgi:hypothetical protein
MFLLGRHCGLDCPPPRGGVARVFLWSDGMGQRHDLPTAVNFNEHVLCMSHSRCPTYCPEHRLTCGLHSTISTEFPQVLRFFQIRPPASRRRAAILRSVPLTSDPQGSDSRELYVVFLNGPLLSPTAVRNFWKYLSMSQASMWTYLQGVNLV